MLDLLSMNIRKRATASECSDTSVYCFHSTVPHGYSYDERECSLSSTVSDADSAIPTVPTLKHGHENVEIGSIACLEMLQGTSAVSPDEYNRMREKKRFKEAAWTDQKHRSYLNLMETEFVRSLYHHHYHTLCSADSVDEDCVESLPTINTSCEPEEMYIPQLQQYTLGSRQVQRPVTELAGTTNRSRTMSLSNSLGSELGADSTTTRSYCSVSVDEESLTNKKKQRTLDLRSHESIDLELHVSDLTTRLFKQRYASNLIPQRKSLKTL